MDPQTLQLMEKMNATQELLAKHMMTQKAIDSGLTGTMTAQTQFNAQGIWSNFGLSDTVVSTVIMPKGLTAYIPAVATNELNPLYPYFTGIIGDGTDEPDGPCDDAPSAYNTACHQTATFGRIARSSKEMEVNELAKILNGKLTTEMRLFNDIYQANSVLDQRQGVDQQAAMKQVIALQMVNIATEFQRWLLQKTWSGDPANNTSGGYAEFPGLDMLISTGKVDAIKGTLCPGLDSDVKDFNYNMIDSSDPSILEYITMMHWYLQSVADMTNMDPVQWAIVCRRQLFYELTAIWPCLYLTNKCSTGASSSSAVVGVINDDTNVRMRDEMRRGKFLWINGEQVQVILDDGITRQTPTTTAELSPGEFASDLYFVPLVAKGMPSVFLEYVDFNDPLMQMPSEIKTHGQWWPTDGGRYLWTMEQMRYCFKIMGKLEPRLILRTPQLAGKIQNIKYSPLQVIRDWNPESPYYAGGGDSSYTTPPTYYSEWNEPQQ